MPSPLYILKSLLGQMDMDSTNENILSHFHREAWNIRFTGPKGNEQPQVINGNRLLSGQTFLPVGTNKMIGWKYDSVYKRIFYWNCNSNGNHAIYILNTLTQTFQTLLAVGPLTQTDTSVLASTFNGPIDNIDILYGDPQEGDLLCFLDSLGRPSKLNIQRYLANTYPVVLRPYINVIKAPPLYPPHVVYENDFIVNNNNLLNSLFLFAYTWIYDDNEESVLSAASVMPMPVHPFTAVNAINSVPVAKSNDARIGLFLKTGPPNVKKINIYMKQTQNGSTSDWMFVDTVDKTAALINNNDVYKYTFYNSGNYTPVDPAFTIDLFDYVPDQAGCQTIINGDTLLYGDIVEGYDWFKSTFSLSVNTGSARHSIPGFLFFASTDGTFTGTQPNIKLVISGAGANGVNGNPTSVSFAAGNMWVYANSDAVGDISFNVSTLTPSGTVATLLASLQSAAVSAGWSVAAQTDPNSIRIYYPTGNISLKGSYYNDVGPGTTIDSLMLPVPRLAQIESANYSYALRYKDSNGKSNGAITDVTANISMVRSNTPLGNVNPFSSVLINLAAFTPPSWAVAYDILRTDNLTYSKRFDWVSKRTLNGVDPDTQNHYAYIDITNIDDFNAEVQASTPNVTYGFDIGDRIRFNALYVPQGGTSYMTNDYPVVGLVIDPLVNGQVQQGRFITIIYPQSDVIANPSIAFQDSYLFANYNITIYHTASNNITKNAGSTASQGNVYFGTGFTFGIGNAGLNTAYHYGNIANNQVQIQDGDWYYRQRTIPIGSSYYYYAAAIAFSGRYGTAILTPNPTPVTVPAFYAISAQAFGAADPFNGGNYPRFSDPGGMFADINATIPINVRLRATVSVSSEFVTWCDITVKLVHATLPVITITVLAHSQSVGNGTTTIDTITFAFDSTFAVPAGYKAWFIVGNGEINPGTTNTHFGGYMLRLDTISNITIQCFDKSYSDTYNLVTNSDDQPDTQDIEQKRLEYGTLYRWGQQDQLNSNQNNSNRFYFTDSDEALKNYGKLIRLCTVGKLLHMFHERKFGTTGVFQQWVKTNSGADQLIVSDTIITKNNIRYEIYDGGIGNQSGSPVISNYAIYCVDPVKGFVIRWSLDGITLISLLYRFQTWAGNNLPNYLNSYTYQFGGDARILGAFYIQPDNNSLYLLMAQAGINAAGVPIDGQGRVLSFDETDNAFESFYNINADGIINAENTLYTAYNGLIYIHDTNATPANFFGTQYPSSIDLVFNEKEALKKNFLGLRYQSNQWWICPNVGDIQTNYINLQTGLQQQSQLLIPDGEQQETMTYFAFLKDANSMLDPRYGLLEGDYLVGNWISLHLVYAGGGPAFLQFPELVYEELPLNF